MLSLPSMGSVNTCVDVRAWAVLRGDDENADDWINADFEDFIDDQGWRTRWKFLWAVWDL